MPASRQLFFTPDTYFNGLIRDIDSASKTIQMETYIFKLDRVGKAVIDALRRALARGVRLQLLIDGIGSYRDAAEVAEQLKSTNSEVRIFHPLPWDFTLYRRALNAARWYSQALYFIASINHRNHRKLCLVDYKTAWLGSYNITSDHANPSSTQANDYWHDTGLRVTGTALPSLVQSFEQVWQQKVDTVGARSRRFLASDAISQRRQAGLQLLRLLDNSQQRICITNAYFNPTRQVLKTLIRKSRQGLDVQLLVPRRSDVVFFPLLSRSFYADLLQAGIRVYEYGERILHSKTMVIDDCLVVGSTNLNYRSLFHDLELDLVTRNPDAVAQMERRFANDVKASTQVTLADWQQHTWIEKLLALVSRMLRYWL